MLSRELKDLKKGLESVLKRYKEIRDIVLFGSALKGKAMPVDIDVAIVMQDKNMESVKNILKNIQDIDAKLHIEFLNPEDVYLERVGLTILTEGYSIKENKFIRDILNIKPKEMIIYSINDMPHNEKLKFGRAIRNVLKTVNGEKMGTGNIVVPIEQAGYIDDFMGIWGIKYKIKKVNMF